MSGRVSWLATSTLLEVVVLVSGELSGVGRGCGGLLLSADGHKRSAAGSLH